MRKTFSAVSLILIFMFSGCSQQPKQAKSLTFSGAFALYPLNLKWSEEYKKTHPDIKFNIQPGGAGKGLTDALSGAADAGMFSREISSNELSKGVWYIALAKDAVFATVNSSNPYIDVLKKRGLTKEELKKIFVDGSVTTWEELLKMNSKTNQKINVYSRSDASGAAESWAAFFNVRQDRLKGIGMMGDPGIADAVKKDKEAIGFNNTQYIFDISTGNKVDGIDVLPLDVNGNGKVDSSESFYSNLQTIENAVLNGRYPSPPVRDLYFVCKQKPTDTTLLNYFKWVLTDGQQFIKGAGYVPLPDSVIQEQLKKIAEP